MKAPLKLLALLGVKSPPNCSRQTGIKTSFLAKSKTFWQGFDASSYLQATPNKQTLISFNL